jgi:CBS domain-containing protein
MRVHEIMVRDVASCRPNDAMSEAARLMWDHDCGIVPVIDEDGRLCGVITDRDLCMACLTQGIPLHQLSVAQAMTPEPVVCAPDQDVSALCQAMRERQVRRIPVVDEDQRLVGIVSLSDVTRRAGAADGRNAQPMRAQVFDTLAAVVRPRATTPV